MNWTLFFKEKFKAALILLVLMTAIILSNIFEKRILLTSSESVKSIYQDRLKPSTDIYEMRDLNAKHYTLLEKISSGSLKDEEIKRDLLRNEMQLKVLVHQYEQTYLVEREKVILNLLKSGIIKLNYLSKEISKNQDNKTLINNARFLSEAINGNLSELSKLQNIVGQELLSNYEKEVTQSRILNTLQIFFSIVIGIIIFAMFTNTGILLSKTERFHLN